MIPRRWSISSGWGWTGFSPTARTGCGSSSSGRRASRPGGKDGMPHPPPSPWSFLPFVALLLSIAVFPLVRRLEHFWEKNLNKLLVALALGLLTLAYYFFAIG